VLYSYIFRIVDGNQYDGYYNIYEYILHHLESRENNAVLHYILSKHELRAADIMVQYWIEDFPDFEIIQRDVLIYRHHAVSLIPEWGEKVQDANIKYYDLPDGSHLKGYRYRARDPVDISEFVYAEISRRGQKSARS
jgi:hypothetical protein